MARDPLDLDLRKTPPPHIADLLARQEAALERRHHPKRPRGVRLRDLTARCRHRDCDRTIPGLALTKSHWGYTATRTLRCPIHATRQEKLRLHHRLNDPHTGFPDHRMWDVLAAEITAAQEYD